jgi:hypothetical protein
MVDDGFLEAAGRMSEDEFLGRYGPWEAMTPAEVAAELAGCGVPWWVAGGRAARVGAAARRHDDTDAAVLAGDVDAIRAAMAGWHLWENIDGALRPLLPGVPVRAECGQLWVRRDARSPWRMEFLIDRVSTGTEWVFKRDDPARQRLLAREDMILLLGQCEQPPFPVIRHIGSVPPPYDIL